MKDEDNQLRIISGSCFTLAVFASCFVLYVARDVFVPFTLALFLFYSINPLPSFLSKKLKVSRPVSIVITFFVIGSVVFLLIFGSVISINSFISDLSIYQKKLQIFVEKIIIFFNENGVVFDKNQVKQNILELPIFNISKSMASFASSFIGSSLLVLLLLVFIFLSSGVKNKTNKSLDRIGRSISLYTDTKIAVSLATAILTWIVMAVVGLDLSLMLVILTFLLNFIPSIGSVIAILLPLPIALLQFGPSSSLLSLIVFLPIIQFTIGNVLEPKLMGRGLGIHPITVLVSLILWGLIWGIPGMFLSVPVTVSLKIICEEFSYTKNIAKVIEGDF
jgi:AI-2 transport protein TqsA